MQINSHPDVLDLKKKSQSIQESPKYYFVDRIKILIRELSSLTTNNFDREVSQYLTQFTVVHTLFGTLFDFKDIKRPMSLGAS